MRARSEAVSGSKKPLSDSAERPVRDEQDRRPPGITHNRHVLMPLLERGLINAQDLWHRELTAGETAGHRALHDARHLVPAQGEQLGDGFDTGVLQPFDDQTLEEGGEARPGGRPGHLQLSDPMRRTFDSRNLPHEHGLVLHRVKVSPRPRPGVVARAGLTTLRARRRCIRPEGHKHLHRVVLHRDVHLDDFPWWFESEKLGIQVTVLHAGMLHLLTPTLDGVVRHPKAGRAPGRGPGPHQRTRRRHRPTAAGRDSW